MSASTYFTKFRVKILLPGIIGYVMVQLCITLFREIERGICQLPTLLNLNRSQLINPYHLSTCKLLKERHAASLVKSLKPH
jgi:hypothetical protein